jgi:protein-S-isoprenylcysteine O-methyltransferase Ste14
VSTRDVALALYAVFGLVTLGLRIAIQLRRTGSTGFKGVSGGADLASGALLVAGIAAGVVGPIEVDPIGPLDGPAGHVAGACLLVAGTALTLYSQLAMGRSWRIGVDPGERTELVTGGPFALVRNPIYSAMLTAFAGLALMVPNAVTIGAFALVLIALEIQTRVVEEPHLLRAHGDAYAAYAARVGRFVPGLGKLRG